MHERRGRVVPLAAIVCVFGLSLTMCGSDDVPIDQQERWQCSQSLVQKCQKICRPCNSNADCSGIAFGPYTTCAPVEPPRVAPPGFTGECRDENEGSPTQGDCKFGDFCFDTPSPVTPPNSSWNAVTCFPTDFTQEMRDECCQARCEATFNRLTSGSEGDVTSCVRVAPAAPVRDATNTIQKCDGSEAGLQFECSPFTCLPEGHSKAQIASRLDATSRVTINVKDHASGALTPSGTIRYTIDECGGAACPIHLTWFAFDVADFSIDDTPITAVSAQTSRQSTDGVINMATGDFTLPASSMRIGTNFIIDGTRGSLTVRNTMALPGTVDPVTKVLTLKGQVSQDDVKVDLDLRATPFNRPPRAVGLPAGNVECNVAYGASVTLDGTTSTDPDANIFSMMWSIPGVGTIGLGETVPFRLPLGTTTLQLFVLDRELADSFDRQTVTVVDSTAPTLTPSVDLPCLWAPDHKMVLFELGTNLTASTSDVCDPAPKVSIASVTSNQPALGGGQGAFSPDVSFGKKGFCVRAERQGTNPAPRIYTVNVESVDLAGNRTTKSVSIHVNHDQAGVHCPRVDGSRVVEDADSRCTAN